MVCMRCLGANPETVFGGYFLIDFVNVLAKRRREMYGNPGWGVPARLKKQVICARKNHSINVIYLKYQ